MQDKSDDNHSFKDLFSLIRDSQNRDELIQYAANWFQRCGFDQVVISLRDASLNPVGVATAGIPDISSDQHKLALNVLPGAVWRRRLAHLGRFRQGELYMLDGRDDWVAREFFGCLPAPVVSDGEWLGTDLIVGLLRSPEPTPIGFVKLAVWRNGGRPGSELLAQIELVVGYLGMRLAHDRMCRLASRRHERLQLLQEAGSTLTRSLDEVEVVRELVRQTQRVVECDGVAVVVPDVHSNQLVTLMRVNQGVECARTPTTLGDGVVAEVARSGRSVRFGDREADRARGRDASPVPLLMDDVLGEPGAAVSVIAVPMRVGIRLVAVLVVHSASADVYTPEDEEVLATLAGQAATAMVNARRYAESERERRTTEALADVARAVSESLRLGEVLRLILRHSLSLLDVEGACVALKSGEYLHIIAAAGKADVLKGMHVPIANSQLGSCILGNDVLVFNAPGEEPLIARSVVQLMPVQRVMMAPLSSGRGVIGAITMINRNRSFDQDDSRLLKRMADQVAVAIDNARLFEEVERVTRQWRAVFDTTSSGIVVLEESLTVSRCNIPAAQLCSTDVHGLLGSRFREALIGPDGTPGASAVDQCITRAMNEKVAARAMIDDPVHGRILTMLVNAHPDGGCVITFDDVTETTRLAERHRNVLETVSDAIIILGLDWRVAFANRAASELFQYDSLTNVSTADLLPPEWVDTVSSYEMMTRGGTHVHYECVIRRRDGTRRIVEVSSTPLVELGVIRGTVSAIRDVTEQRANAHARERSEVLYSRLVESASDIIFTADRDGLLTSVNQGFMNTFGVSREMALEGSFGRFVDPVDSEKAERAMQAALSGERPRVSLRCIGVKAAMLVVMTISPIHVEGQVVSVLGIVRDMTEDEVRHESRVQETRLAAIGQSVGRVANELNNPLASLLALAELHLESPDLSKESRKVMAQVLDEASRASRIVNRILDSTGEYAQSNSRRMDLSVNRIVYSAMDVARHGLATLDVRTRMNLADDLPDVYGHSLQLQQVVVNLLTNAEQALAEMAGPRILEVETFVDSFADGRPAVAIRVVDNGPGITESRLKRVFDPMFTTHADRGQRGLGLVIAQTIVRDHGGLIELQPADVMGGVSVTVRLPVAGSATLPRRTTPAFSTAVAALDTSSEPAGSEPLRATNILLVEDEPSLRTAIARFLSGLGYEADAVDSGEAGMEAVATKPYDLILLDLRMTGMSGEHVYEQLLANHPDQAERVVFMTGDMHSDEASRFIRNSGRQVLAKPFSLSELEDRLRQMLGS